MTEESKIRCILPSVIPDVLKKTDCQGDLCQNLSPVGFPAMDAQKEEADQAVGLSDMTSAREQGGAESREDVIRKSHLFIHGGRLLTHGGRLLTRGGRLFARGGRLLTHGGRLLARGGGLLTHGGGLLTHGGGLLTHGGGLLTHGGRLLTLGVGLRVFGGLHKDPTRRKSKSQQDNQETKFPHHVLLVRVIGMDVRRVAFS